MRTINLIDMLEKDLDTNEHVSISLKSSIPLFLVYPELIYGFSSLSEIAEMYDDNVDYHDVDKHIIIDNTKQIDKLIMLFANVFSDLVGKPESSNLEGGYRFPAFSLVIDIGSANRSMELVSPTEEQVSRFSNSQVYTFKAKIAHEESVLSNNQKHNIILADMLTRKANDTGLGGL